MLNHEVEKFRFLARESLKLDMSKRNVKSSDSDNNFLGYELNDNGFLVTGNSFGCQSDWPDMVRYCRKLNVCVKCLNDIAVVSDADGNILSAKKLCYELINVSIKSDL